MPMMPGLDEALEGGAPGTMGPDDEPFEDETGAAPPGELDALFAADVAKALPDLEDDQILALQRAFLGLVGGGLG